MTCYTCSNDLSSLINRLEHDSLLAIKWFENNRIKLNQEKCHILVSEHKAKKKVVLFPEIGWVKITHLPT